MTQAKDLARRYPIHRLGRGPLHHFFGYYDKTVWDLDDRLVLANQVDCMTADLTPDMQAQVGYFDTRDSDRFHVCGVTTAWNWQMGCQLQWLDGRPGRQFIYNVRRDGPRSGWAPLGSTRWSNGASQCATPSFCV